MKQILALIIIFTSLAASTFAMQKKENNTLSFDSYDASWSAVAGFEKVGQTRSAMKEVDVILLQAEKDFNSPQMIKALLHKFKYTMVLEEDAELKIIELLNKHIELTDDELARAVLHSVKAEGLWNYYQSNRHKFYNRSSQTETINEDFRTWDLASIMKEIRKHHLLALEQATDLQQASINTFDPILLQGDESNAYRPTLYDLLAHRAIDFFMNGESGLTEGREVFALDQEAYFSSAEEFVALKISGPESLKKDVLMVFQELLAFRLKSGMASAFMDADLKRIRYLHQESDKEDKDALFVAGLTDLTGRHKNDDFTAYINYHLAVHYNSVGKQATTAPQGDETNYRLLARDLCEWTIERFPKAFGSTNCTALLQQIESKHLTAKTERVLIPGLPHKVSLGYGNIDEAHLKLVRLTADEVFNLRLGHDQRQKWIKRLMHRDAQLQWKISLTDPGDLYDHTTEVAMSGVEMGVYMLFTSKDGIFNEDVGVAGDIWVSDLSYLTRKNDKGNLEVYVLDRNSGFPVKGAQVRSYYLKYDYNSRKNNRINLDSFTTDKHGQVVITPPKDRQNVQISFDITYESDFLDISQNHYLSKPYDYPVRWNQQTHFFTDRAIYRPGQTVYFKGITLNTNSESSEILPNHGVTVIFKDVNGREISSQLLYSNEYGSFNGSFTAPSGGLMGRMSLEGGNGYTSIQVEEYKRPTFEVILDPMSGSYALDQEVSLTGKGISYAGAPLSNSVVKYRVVREVRYPYWWSYYGRSPTSSTSREIAFGEVITDENGTFQIDFETFPDISVGRDGNPQFRFTVSVDLVDISGETRSNTKTVTAGYTGLVLNVAHPEHVDRTSSSIINFSVTNLDGKEEAADVEIKLYRLESGKELYNQRRWAMPDIFHLSEREHQRTFPNDIYKTIQDTDRKKELVGTYHINTGDQTSIVVDAAVMTSSAEYWLSAKTEDDNGNEINYEGKFIATSNSDTHPIPSVHLKLSADKHSYQPGDVAIIEMASSLEQTYLIYKMSFNGDVIESDAFELSDEIKRLSIPIGEQHRGGIMIQCAIVSKNRTYSEQLKLDVPFESTELDVEWMTFRDLLQPGAEQEWKVKISGPNGDRIQAELLASMYDKSLDYFKPHNYYFNTPHHPHIKQAETFQPSGSFQVGPSWLFNQTSGKHINISNPHYDQLNLFGFSMYKYAYRTLMKAESFSINEVQVTGNGRGLAGGEWADASSDEDQEGLAYAADIMDSEATEVNPPEATVSENEILSPRKNLNETAFFFPQLQTNEAGEVIISFTMPEALTTWKFMGLAHDKNLQSKIFTKELKTQMDLMVTPHFPRFFRENDKVIVSAKVDNLTDRDLKGKVVLKLKDALTGQEIHGQLVEGNEHHTEFPASSSTSVEWDIVLGDKYQAITYEVYAIAEEHTDGVSSSIPVLTNRMMVTESMPIWLKGAGEQEFTFNHLKDYSSTTLEHYQYTLEYASNPAWYAVQALPYLMEFPYECAEQLFSRYYANTLALHITGSNPRIEEIFDQWRTLDSEALLSNLEKNQELKSVLIEETPWLRDAVDESERKKRIALLFDLNRMASERQNVLFKLKEIQTPNGGFSWFPGMRDNRYITQHILTGLAHLQQLDVAGIMEDDIIREIIDKAIPYLDARIAEDFRDIKKYDKDWKKNDHLGSIQIQYLYVRAHFKDYQMDEGRRIAHHYFLEQAEKFWSSKNLYHQAMISIALHGYFKKEVAQQIVVSLEENSIVSDEMGMYWKAIEQGGGYYWYNAPIESQAMLIEAFHTVADDEASVNEMKVWLLKQKQVQDWRTTKATSEAIFALLLRGEDWLSESKPVTIQIGGEEVDVKARDGSYEAGTGYFKVNWEGSEIDRVMANVKVSSTSNVPSWGAVYWQYFEDLDKIREFEETPLKLKKNLFVETNSDAGPVITLLEDYGDIKPGDKLKVRIELTVDRNMEFVHMKDMRASGLEPENVISRYKYQDGLGYYESTRDAATHFFFDYLPKGIYVFEYPLRVSHKGDFSNGITSIQSMYAPEFASHSEGVRIEVK